MQIALDLFHEGRDSGRIRDFLARGLRRDHLLDRRARGPRADVRKGIAPAGEAGVGRDLDQNHIERRDRRGALPEARYAGVIGNADVVRPDVGDQHVCLSRPDWQTLRHGRACPAIHVLLQTRTKDVDARHKAGHDEFRYRGPIRIQFDRQEFFSPHMIGPNSSQLSPLKRII